MSLGINVEPSRSLVHVGGDPHAWPDWWDPGVTLFALDDAMEEREWGSIHMEFGDAVHALTTMLSSMRNIVASLGQV